MHIIVELLAVRVVVTQNVEESYHAMLGRYLDPMLTQALTVWRATTELLPHKVGQYSSVLEARRFVQIVARGIAPSVLILEKNLSASFWCFCFIRISVLPCDLVLYKPSTREDKLMQ